MSSKSPTVLVTGCSRGGIGYELCLALSQAKCTVYASGRRLESMAGLKELGIHCLSLDVNSEQSIKDAVDELVNKEGKIDILVNNAGVSCPGPVAEVSIEEARACFETNIFGLLAVTQAVFPHMARQRSGKIVNIGSILGYVPTPWSGIYCASKAALHSLTDTLRLELKPFGISTLLIAPGVIGSNFSSNSATKLSLMRLRLYKPFEATINESPANSPDPNATPVDVFAKKIVKVVLKGSPPAHYSFGTLANLFGMFRWLPNWLVDTILATNFGLSNNSIKKALKPGKLLEH